MKTCCLASSSAGNCFLLTFDMGGGREASLLVECGIPYRTILGKMNEAGKRLSEVVACLMTHSHQDHSRAASDLRRVGVPLFATKGTLDAVGVTGTAMIYGKPTRLADGLFAVPFRVLHDAPEPAGFVLLTKTETTIFSIDCGRWVDDPSAYVPDYVLIEANYDPALMNAEQFSLRCGARKCNVEEYNRNVRQINYHMGLDSTIKSLNSLDLSRCKAVFLTHLSDRMSSAKAFKREVKGLVGVEAFVCGKNGGIE